MELYDDNIDYKKKHLLWIAANPRFSPKTPFPRVIDGRPCNTYYKYMEFMYLPENLKYNKTAFYYLHDDFKFSRESRTINDEVATMFGVAPINNNPKYFITWNFNDTNFNIPVVVKNLERLINKNWIDNFDAVIEYYGTKDNHPHIHAVIQVNQHKTWGRLKAKILQQPLSNMIAPNFTDVKQYRPIHDDYVDGDKVIKKQNNLEKDIIWRNERGLQHKYCKQNCN